MSVTQRGLFLEDTPILHDRYPREVGCAPEHDGMCSMEYLNIELGEAARYFRETLPEKVDYGQMVGAESWAWGCRYVYEDEEGYFKEYAVRALEELALLRDLYHSKNLRIFPVKPGDIIYLVRDREVQTRTVQSISITTDRTLILLDDGSSVTVAGYEKEWFDNIQDAQTKLSNQELARVGLLFDFEDGE